MTSSKNSAYLVVAKKLGSVHGLEKPVDEEELIAAIQKSHEKT